VILHTASYAAYEQGLIAGADQIHHAPLDIPVDDRLLAMFRSGATKAVCPTLTMMRAIVQQAHIANTSFAPANATVAKLHAAGVPIMAGTDANAVPGVPAFVSFGTSLHDELENLVDAGLTPLEALRAATVAPSKFYGLHDRGAIVEGARADLVLIDGDPTVNISTTRNIQKVWIGGVQFNAANWS
jgi:imidazolonepropionase-like amidohydrolase